MLLYSGKLLVAASPIARDTDPIVLEGFSLEPLFPSFLATIEPASDVAEHWFIASSPDVDPEENPWDAAHRVAATRAYSVYVEPDLLHELRSGDDDLKQLKPHWPPHGAVCPAWHLEASHTGFSDVRSISTGSHVRIAHLDTGYTPHHMSTPRNLAPCLGWDYFANGPIAIDPGTPGLLLQPGHGTATLAVLAGNHVNLFFAGQRYEGDFGGAPDAEVVPVRISPSVIHLFTRTMAQGIDHAIAPRGRTDKKCQVVSISHGGLPARSWAAAVNQAYEAGIVIVAASGDSFHYWPVDVPPHETVWPSRFARVITAVGATYDKKPYVTHAIGEMQGSWGPASVMRKAVAAYTPNMAWMDFKHRNGFTMDGAGTSMSTPQIAAACALWLDLYRSELTDDWRRVAACTTALLASAVLPREEYREFMGCGILDVPRLLRTHPRSILADETFARAPEAEVDSRAWLALGNRAAPSRQDKMFEVEFLHATMRLGDPKLAEAVRNVEEGGSLNGDQIDRLLRAVIEDPDISNTLRAFLRDRSRNATPLPLPPALD